MIIPVNQDFRITSDRMQRMVQESYLAGEEKVLAWKTATYHQSLSGAVNSLYHRGIRASDAQTLDEALKHAEDFLGTLTKALTPEVKVVKVV